MRLAPFRGVVDMVTGFAHVILNLTGTRAVGNPTFELYSCMTRALHSGEKDTVEKIRNLLAFAWGAR